MGPAPEKKIGPLSRKPERLRRLPARRFYKLIVFIDVMQRGTRATPTVLKTAPSAMAVFT